MKKLGIALAGLLLITGCGGSHVEGGYSHDRGESNVIPDTSGYVKMLEISGTTCIIFRDGDMGGISCNWPNETVTETTDGFN